MHTKIISFEEAVVLAGKHFGLTIPIRPDSLKESYRKQSKKLHPDIGGTKEAFQEMNNAYEKLSSAQWIRGLFDLTDQDPTDLEHAVTLDGTPLSQLFK